MKKNIAIVTGGNSSEYDISLQSAETIINNIDKSEYDAYKIVINGGQWVLKRNNEEDIAIDKNDFSCIIENNKITFDCAFIAIHGTPGEDGKLQGYFDLLNIPYTTPGVLTTALTFDKNACNKLLKQYGVLSPASFLIKKEELPVTKEILSKISLPCFVKPNNGGSSYGISKVNKPEELESAINKALEHDDEALVELFIDGMEITCGVIKIKGEIKALGITEIVSHREFFDYEAKYLGMSDEITPARISKEIEKECMDLSVFIYKKLNCKGMVRMDYILSEEKPYLIEVNITPGLTEESLYPKQAKYAGISLKDLFTSVIEETLKEDTH